MKKNYLLLIALFSFVFSYSQCDHTFVMNDAYGDGWNGSTVDILVDGVVVVEAATAADQGLFNTPTTENLLFNVTEGSSITLSNWTTGQWTTEVSWSILDLAGIELASGFHSEVADVTANCTPPSCYPPAITSWNMTPDGVVFDGTNSDDAIGYTLEYSETTFTPGDGTATVYEFDSFPQTLTGLAYNTTYYFAMQSNCGDSVSAFIGSPDPWITLSNGTGNTAYAPIIIESIPYSTTADTNNYGNDYNNSGIECDWGNEQYDPGQYLDGYDVVYSYTAASTMNLDINLTPTANYAAIFVYENAEDVGVNCWIATKNIGGSNPASFSLELSVIEGSTYYFVVSGSTTPPNFPYDLSITELLCSAPTNLTVTDVTTAGADISWDAGDAGEAVSWEYVLSTLQYYPSTEAVESLSEPNVSIVDLNTLSAYYFWVRAICDDGSTSEWTSVAFTTLPTTGCGESLSQFEYPSFTGGGSTFDDNFDIANDYSASLLFSTTAGDQDGDGTVDEVTVTISGSTENNFDWVFATNGAGELLYGPVSGAQDEVVTSTDGTINVYLAADSTVMGGPISFDVSCAGLSVNDFDLSDLKLYPNPVNGDYVTIQSSVSGEKNIEVYDITGKRLINTTLNSDKLDVSSVSSGVYLVKVTVQGQTKVSKLVIR
ncbi:T9SS type A sorting domain-containing protein [Flavobacteriaceae bacterium]|nr:T9SS type A sorting domain-containing protein [Flavobacteriaceae bacterium]